MNRSVLARPEAVEVRTWFLPDSASGANTCSGAICLSANDDKRTGAASSPVSFKSANRAMRSSVGIQRDLHGNSLTLHGFAQKSLGGVDVTVPTPVEIDRLPSLVDRPIQVHPFAAHLHVRLIHAPGAADRAGVAFPPLLELRTVMLHPPP